MIVFDAGDDTMMFGIYIGSDRFPSYREKKGEA